MNYFRCTVGGSGKGNTVTVTCAEEFAGLTITLAKTGKTYTKTCPSTAPYVVTFYGVENGTYTVSTTYDGQTYSETVIVQDISCVLNYGFNWKLWVDTASQLDSSDYDSLDEVLADEKALRELFLEHACVDYMAESTVSNADLETIINDDYCAKWINNCDYALDFLGANTVIKALMDEADKYGYGEWALMPQVPTMTSNTAPYGTASASSALSGNEAYKAFSGIDTTPGNADIWQSATGQGVNAWIQYEAPTAYIAKSMRLKGRANSATNTPKDYEIYGLNNTSDTPTLIDSGTLTTALTTGVDITIPIANDTAYKIYRFKVISLFSGSTSDSVTIGRLQFYAYAPKGNVPVMTSATAPYGEVIASNYDGSSYPYLAFDGNDGTIWGPKAGDNTPYLGYKFTNPVCVRRVSYSIRDSKAGRPVRTIVVQGSNDNSTWNDLGSFELPGGADPIASTVDISNTGYYLYYRLYCSQALNVQSSWWYPFISLQFYGRELKVSVPTMTSNTAPYGTVSATFTAIDSSHDLYKAFDNDDSSFTYANTGYYVAGIGYDFLRKISLKYARVKTIYAGMPLNVQFSDDNSSWSDASNYEVTVADTFVEIPITEIYAHRYWRIHVDTNRGSGETTSLYIKSIQFYGLDYSEKEFESGTTKKWLYDHGVELVELEKVNSFSVGITKEESDILFNAVSSSTGNGATTTDAIDVTEHSLLRAKVGNLVGAGIYVGIHTNKSPTWWSPTATANYALGNAGLPNKLALNISNINGNNYPMVVQSYPSNGSKLAELWLE